MPNDIRHDAIVASAGGAGYPSLITSDHVGLQSIEWNNAPPGATCEFREAIDAQGDVTSTGGIIYKSTMVGEPQQVRLGVKRYVKRGIFCNALTGGVVYFRSGA